MVSIEKPQRNKRKDPIKEIKLKLKCKERDDKIPCLVGNEVGAGPPSK